MELEHPVLSILEDFSNPFHALGTSFHTEKTDSLFADVPLDILYSYVMD